LLRNPKEDDIAIVEKAKIVSAVGDDNGNANGNGNGNANDDDGERYSGLFCRDLWLSISIPC
jgi:hypothetical protein